jgi:hypothetical protein
MRALSRGLEAEFWGQFQQFEQERRMPYITSVERIGYERGEKTVVLRQLKKRMGDIPEELRSRIESLSLKNLELISEALLDFSTVDDLVNWLSSH